MAEDDICEVVITADDEDWLVAFSHRLVRDRLAACGHHTPIRSVYTWQGELHDERETRVALHTRQSLVEAIIVATQDAHAYDVPCVIALPVLHASTAYRAWVLDATS